MIELRNLQKGYGKAKSVLKNVTLTLSDGTTFALLGADGVGKTTLLRVLSGILQKEEGQVCVDGQDPYENVACKRETFFLSENPFFSWNATVRDLANRYAAVYPFENAVFEEYLRAFTIEEKTYLRACSHGVRKQVFAALAFAVAPKYLLFDEFFEGIDPLAAEIVKRGLREWQKQRNGIALFASRSLTGLTDVCNRFGVLRNGELLSLEKAERGDLHKFQAAYDRRVFEGEFPFSCLSFQQCGKVVRLIARGNGTDLRNGIEQTSPLFAEEIEASVEDFFLETTRRKEAWR